MRGRNAFAKRVLWIVAMLGCQGSQPPEPIVELDQPIVGGTEATTCQWPSTVMLIGPSVCTGELVHPRAVVTAKHCLMDPSETRISLPAMVGFGEIPDQWARTVAVSTCYLHPTNDMGLCILAKDVTDVPIVPVMAPCETTELLPGRPIVEVGFGVTEAKSKTAGRKKWINGTIESRSTSLVNILVTTGTQDGEYFGDSGGPLFFKMPDQTWRLIGEDWGSENIRGDAGPRISTYTSVPYHVPWMEEQSGLDLTPCHDMGGWNPDDGCIGSPTNPGAGVGTWADGCPGQTMVRAQTCAPSPYDAGAREAGIKDGAVEVRDSNLEGDGSPDFPIADGPGLIADGGDARPDGLDTGELVAGADAAIPPSDTSAARDSAPISDAAQAPGDTGFMTMDTSAQDAHLDLADRHPVADASHRVDASAGGLTIRRMGCACRMGDSRSADGWPMPVVVGLVWALGHALRRRRGEEKKS